ncbi:hypothetical protein GCM10027275_08270 [Rhabdobacter roseus]|uniref:SdrD B-like domain-containing protein n=1 Tax=Rhabdobacter roseus TaxID=1655419 RepID=UPI001C851EE8
MLATTLVANAQLSGSVFRDMNGDGLRQTTSPAEPGVKAVKVTAYLADGSTLATTTDSTGAYSFTVAGGLKVRLEFSELPFASYSGMQGISNASSVQFVTTPTTTAHLGLSDPLMYCNTQQPDLVTPGYVVGDAASGSGAASLNTLFRFPSNATGQGMVPGPLAVAGQLGTVWGGAYQRQHKKLFQAAFLKRHSSLGPLGLGGVYTVDLSGGAPVVTPYVDLSQFVRLSSPEDSTLLLTRDLNPDYKVPSVDSAAFGLVGKVGLGGMAISPDEKTLWFINLYEKTLVQLTIGSPVKPGNQLTAADVASFPLPSPNCEGGEVRPWALEYREGALYVGLVCDATTSELGTPRQNLGAYVYRFNLATAQFSSTPLISTALDYRKGWVHAGVLQSEYWEPWTDDWSAFTTSLLSVSSGISTYRISRPQPILSSIAFDSDGSLILGFMDRTGHQTGRNQRGIMATDTTSWYSGYVGGDILRAQYYADGTYALENNGTSGSLSSLGGVGNGQGPGGGEFYYAEEYRDINSGNPLQQETFMGGLAVVPGGNEVLAGVIEPFTTWSGGVAWFSNQDGSRSKAYELYDSNPIVPGDPVQAQYLGNANGLGSIEVLCEAAPIQIGNRVWLDTDQDGVQDPDESPLAGVMVALYNQAGSLEALTQTDANGQYLFSSPVLSYNKAYYVVFGTNGAASQFDKASQVLSLNGAYYKLTTTNTGEGDHADLNDSDAQLATELPTSLNGYPYIAVQTGAPGQNNPNLDAGFISCWVDAGADTTVCAGITSVQLAPAAPGASWAALGTNPAAATINNEGLIEGLTEAGHYYFVLAQSETCRDTMKVTVKAAPSATAMITAPTCLGSTSLNDGKIQLTGYGPDEQYNLALGGTFSEPIHDAAQAIPEGGLILADVANPEQGSQAYTIRLFDSVTGCTRDELVSVSRVDCGCGDVKLICVPVVMKKVRSR